ncbi:unnamed protein product [Nippostrongylus brasiliensis]|uniref:DUF4172 domain-containing protein n=1 Tax=Nippostrongylus brasiliensis TaxID=27835 RepID=A0A0N4Y4V2_NIPBR|nr:unnamed protein product [Nippostrongylus brasiliensis]
MKYSECNDISGHVQRAMANMIGLALEELTEEKKKEKIRKVIEGIVTQSGDVEQGASVHQVQYVGIKVQRIL